MKVKIQGIILVSTLMLLMVISLLVLSQLNNALLIYQAVNRITSRHQFFYLLDLQAHKLLTSPMQSAACYIAEKNPDEILQLLIDKKACFQKKEKLPFYYLIEDLGTFPCLQSYLNHSFYSTSHQRISILAFWNEKPFFIQLRQVSPITLKSCDERKPLNIEVGIISWHFLTLQ